MPFHQEIEYFGTVTPNRNAFISDSGVRNYGDLVERSKLFKSYIDSLPGSRLGLPYLSNANKVIALDIGNDVLFPELFVGSTGEGSICAILDPKMREEQVEDVLVRLRPDLIVVRSLDSSVAQIGMRIGLKVEDITSLSYLSPNAPRVDVRTPGEHTDTFLVGFTSGTTSMPKAFSRSRATWRKSLSQGQSIFGLNNGLPTICPGNIAHGLGLYVLAETLHSGGTFYAMNWRSDMVANTLRSGNVQRFVAIPAMIYGLSESNEALQLKGFPDVREVAITGSKLGKKQVLLMRDIFPNARIIEYYGASELGFISVSQVFPAKVDSPIESVGKAFPGVEISIRNSNGELLGCGEIGTIYVQSEQICDGYLWGDECKTFRLGIGGAATVGDIGQLDVSGALSVRGREGGMVIVNGHNIFPTEVEVALRNIEGLDEVVVLGVEDDYGSIPTKVRNPPQDLTYVWWASACSARNCLMRSVGKYR